MESKELEVQVFNSAYYSANIHTHLLKVHRSILSLIFPFSTLFCYHVLSYDLALRTASPLVLSSVLIHELALELNSCPPFILAFVQCNVRSSMFLSYRALIQPIILFQFFGPRTKSVLVSFLSPLLQFIRISVLHSILNCLS